ncbi:MAG: phosphoenolpyruvate carboxykinase [Hespellia sp.]|nr:phosphoenolpyruvate carboxykinase [Hespellia sp.]
MLAKILHSILTDDLDHCMMTGSNVVERHHVFGGAFKAKSEYYGFIAPLRPDLHPNGVHFQDTKENKKIDKYLKRMCQRYYEKHCGTRDQFRNEFGRNYL